MKKGDWIRKLNYESVLGTGKPVLKIKNIHNSGGIKK